MTRNRFAIFFILLVFSIGCTPTVVEEAPAPTLPELAKSLIEYSDEFDFLLSDGAGNESCEACVNTIKDTLGSLSESLPDSGLDDARAAKLSAAIDGAKTAYEPFATAVKSNSSASKMSKANKMFRQKSKVISDFFK